eukprot:g51298.t1
MLEKKYGNTARFRPTPNTGFMGSSSSSSTSSVFNTEREDWGSHSLSSRDSNTLSIPGPKALPASLADRLRQFYQKNAPQKLMSLQKVLQQYGNNEPLLWSKLAEKYGKESVKLFLPPALVAGNGNGWGSNQGGGQQRGGFPALADNTGFASGGWGNTGAAGGFPNQPSANAGFTGATSGFGQQQSSGFGGWGGGGGGGGGRFGDVGGSGGFANTGGGWGGTGGATSQGSVGFGGVSDNILSSGHRSMAAAFGDPFGGMGGGGAGFGSNSGGFGSPAGFSSGFGSAPAPSPENTRMGSSFGSAFGDSFSSSGPSDFGALAEQGGGGGGWGQGFDSAVGNMSNNNPAFTQYRG